MSSVLTALAGAAVQDFVEDRFQGNTAKLEHPPKPFGFLAGISNRLLAARHV